MTFERPYVSSSVEVDRVRPVVERQFFPNSNGVTTLSSIGSVALAAVGLLNGSTELLLYDGARNSTKVVQATVPGGNLTGVSTEVTAGSFFFVEFSNLTTSRVFYERVTTTGRESRVVLPSGHSNQWAVVPGGASALFESANSRLLAVNPSTLATEANYSALVPPGVLVTSVYSNGSMLYLGGTIGAFNGSVPYYGYIDITTGVETTLSPMSIGINQRDHFGVITSVDESGGQVYFGGVVTLNRFTPTFVYKVTRGLLYDYSPSNATLTNLSAIRPIERWGVFTIETAGTTIVMNLATFDQTATTLSMESGTFVMAASHSRLINNTRLMGVSFVTIALDAGASGGRYYLGGLDQTTGAGEILAIPVSLLKA
jgi:hypothetical protein